MAETSYEFGDPRQQIIWNEDIFPFMLQDMFFTKFMGKGEDFLIYTDSDLEVKKGGDVIVDMEEPLTGAGQGNDGRTRGKSEAMLDGNMKVRVGERAHSVESKGKISNQLTKTDIRSSAKRRIGPWGREALEDDIAHSAFGLYNANSSSTSISTINEAVPTSNRIYRGGASAAGVLGNSGATYTTDALMTAGTKASNLMNTKLLEKIRRLSLRARPKFRKMPIRDIRNADPFDPQSLVQAPSVGDFFLVLMSALQIKAIKAETGDAGWKAIVAAAERRGPMNPIFTAASFLWDGMLVIEYDRTPERTGAGGTSLAEGFTLNTARDATSDPAASGRTMARAALLGANAVTFAWAQHPQVYEDFIERDIPIVEFDMIYGSKRTNFNVHGTTTPTSDYAIYLMDTEVLVD